MTVLLVPLLLACQLPATWPPYARFWILFPAVFYGLKLLSVASVPRTRCSAGRWLLYLTVWPGLDAERFLSTTPLRDSLRPTHREWAFACAKLSIGIVVLWQNVVPIPDSVTLRGWVGLVGFGLILMFGIAHLASCLFRSCGIDAEPVAEWPLLARGVGDFWGRRWNRPFSGLARRMVFSPLRKAAGPVPALFIVFVVSAWLHELALSPGATKRYGMPSAYLMLQPFAILLERSRVGVKLRLGCGLQGWCFFVLAVVIPLPLLFHRSCMEHGLAPFLDLIGAVPVRPEPGS